MRGDAFILHSVIGTVCSFFFVGDGGKEKRRADLICVGHMHCYLVIISRSRVLCGRT